MDDRVEIDSNLVINALRDQINDLSLNLAMFRARAEQAERALREVAVSAEDTSA